MSVPPKSKLLGGNTLQLGFQEKRVGNKRPQQKQNQGANIETQRRRIGFFKGDVKRKKQRASDQREVKRREINKTDWNSDLQEQHEKQKHEHQTKNGVFFFISNSKQTARHEKT